MNDTYRLTSFTGLARVGLAQVKLFRDGDSGSTRPLSETDALAQSGDYFVALATKLDTISLSSSEWETRTQLEDVVSDLLYLQDNYHITKKDTE